MDIQEMQNPMTTNQKRKLPSASEYNFLLNICCKPKYTAAISRKVDIPSKAKWACATIQPVPWIYQLMARVCWKPPCMLSGTASSTPVMENLISRFSTNMLQRPFMVKRILATNATAGIRISTPSTDANDFNHSGNGADSKWWEAGVE